MSWWQADLNGVVIPTKTYNNLNMGAKKQMLNILKYTKNNQILGFKCALDSCHWKFEACKEELQSFKIFPKEIKQTHIWAMNIQ